MHPPTVDQIPPFFFKYRPLGVDEHQLDWLKNSLLDGQFYWASPSQFNDPFDCKPTLQMPVAKELRKLAAKLHKKKVPNRNRKQRREFAKLSTHGPPMTAKEMARHLDNLMDRTSVYSLGVSAQDILMWSHYANSHKGVCLRFEGLPFIEAAQWTVYPVMYSADRPAIQVGREEAMEQLGKLLLTKADIWSYEKEWRAIGYKEPPGIRKLDAAILSGAVLGSNIDNDHRNLILQWAEERSTHIAIYQAECDAQHFCINLGPMNDAAASEVSSGRASRAT